MRALFIFWSGFFDSRQLNFVKTGSLKSGFQKDVGFFCHKSKKTLRFFLDLYQKKPLHFAQRTTKTDTFCCSANLKNKNSGKFRDKKVFLTIVQSEKERDTEQPK